MANNLVVDSSVVVKWFVVEPYSQESRLILNEYQAGTIDLLVPDLINSEVGNIIWKKQTFQGLAPTDAQQVIQGFRALKFKLTLTADLLDDAYHLAVQYQRTVYDMMYIALSIREKCPFVTADEKLVNAVGTTFPNVIWVKNWS